MPGAAGTRAFRDQTAAQLDHYAKKQAPAVFEPGRVLEIELAAKGLRAVTLSPGSTGATT
jgi:hypothetical protein